MGLFSTLDLILAFLIGCEKDNVWTDISLSVALAHETGCHSGWSSIFSTLAQEIIQVGERRVNTALIIEIYSRNSLLLQVSHKIADKRRLLSSGIIESAIDIKFYALATLQVATGVIDHRIPARSRLILPLVICDFPKLQSSHLADITDAFSTLKEVSLKQRPLFGVELPGGEEGVHTGTYLSQILLLA